MLVDFIDIRTGKTMTKLEVNPANLPRSGDRFDTGHAEWIVDGIVWAGHPAELLPTGIRLSPVDAS